MYEELREKLMALRDESRKMDEETNFESSYWLGYGTGLERAIMVVDELTEQEENYGISEDDQEIRGY